MNDVEELKRYVVAHARGQRIPDFERLLTQITSDGDACGSWTRVWSEAAEALEERGRPLQASRHYAMARFPYVDGPARQEAQDRCVRTFDAWRSARGTIERLDVDVDGHQVRCWASGLSAGARRPVLLIMGGIVSVKEQWAPRLDTIRRLGLTGIVADMPGVGENRMRYDVRSRRMLSAILDAVADRADVSRTYAMALSFSGHLALRCAVEDSRIRGIITSGAPVSAFFTDTEWRLGLPRITTDALSHMGGDCALRDMALTTEQLAALDIPIRYSAGLRDEIIPAGEIDLLREHVRDLELLLHDDEHGVPRHTAETQMWSMAALMRMCGFRNRTAAIGLMHRAHRARTRLAAGRSQAARR